MITSQFNFPMIGEYPGDTPVIFTSVLMSFFSIAVPLRSEYGISVTLDPVSSIAGILRVELLNSIVVIQYVAY